MPQKQPNEPMNFSSFADWCRHIDSLSEGARHTVEVLLKKAGTDDAEAAETILSSMTELELGGYRISDISFLSSLTNLTKLHLYDNQITDISFLRALANLTELHLYHNQITDFSFLSSLTNLTRLNLGLNKITDISSLGSLTNLTTLDLDFNKITDISSLGSFTNLTRLTLGVNQITDISSLGSLTNLTKLYLHYNQISDISSLGSLINLTELALSNNQITDISSLGSLANLTELDLRDNKITDFSSLGSLTNLSALILENNQITNICSLDSLTNLTSLDLHCNQITDISFPNNLINLTKLILWFNQITDISSLSSLTNLTKLDLASNKITDISSLGSLTNLTSLGLSNNQINDISSLSSLTNLTLLGLGDNQITDISSLASLINLTELYLGNNQITDISSLASLINLTLLGLGDNQITEISALRDLTNLKKLDLQNNQIIGIRVLGELAQKHLTLSTRLIDAPKVTEAIKVAYATIGIEAPEIIICSSPRDAFLQICNLLDSSQNTSDEWCRNRWGKKLDWKSMSLSIVREFVSPAVWEYELDRVTIDPEPDSTLSSLMNELVEEYKGLKKRIGNTFPDSWLSLKSTETPTNLFKQIYLTESYISSSNINFSQKSQEILSSQKQLLEDCGWIFPFEKICLVCDRPRHLRFDSQNRLHAEESPAIEFADGWNFYYYHGVRLPENYGKVHPNLWKAEWVLSESNAELRRVLIQGIGYDRICQELSAEQIDSWQEYTLLKIDHPRDEPIYLLKMTCPSTGFIHALRVPPNLTSAREAIRWVNGGIDPEEFSVQT
jgi:internalin A